MGKNGGGGGGGGKFMRRKRSKYEDPDGISLRKIDPKKDKFKAARLLKKKPAKKNQRSRIEREMEQAIRNGDSPDKWNIYLGNLTP